MPEEGSGRTLGVPDQGSSGQSLYGKMFGAKQPKSGSEGGSSESSTGPATASLQFGDPPEAGAMQWRTPSFDEDDANKIVRVDSGRSRLINLLSARVEDREGEKNFGSSRSSNHTDTIRSQTDMVLGAASSAVPETGKPGSASLIPPPRRPIRDNPQIQDNPPAIRSRQLVMSPEQGTDEAMDYASMAKFLAMEQQQQKQQQQQQKRQQVVVIPELEKKGGAAHGIDIGGRPRALQSPPAQKPDESPNQHQSLGTGSFGKHSLPALLDDSEEAKPGSGQGDGEGFTSSIIEDPLRKAPLVGESTNGSPEAKEVQPGDEIYPLRMAKYIGMMDVIDDGPVPDQRAGKLNAHVDLVLGLERVANLPKKDVTGRCDCFCEVTFKEFGLINLKPRLVQHRTKTVRNNFDPEFGETFHFFLHHMQVMESLQRTGAWSVEIDLYDWDRFKNNDHIGQISLDLRDLLVQPEAGGRVTVAVTDEKGEQVVGHSGRVTEVVIHSKLTMRKSMTHSRSKYHDGAAYGRMRRASSITNVIGNLLGGGNSNFSSREQSRRGSLVDPGPLAVWEGGGGGGILRGSKAGLACEGGGADPVYSARASAAAEYLKKKLENFRGSQKNLFENLEDEEAGRVANGRENGGGVDGARSNGGGSRGGSGKGGGIGGREWGVRENGSSGSPARIPSGSFSGSFGRIPSGSIAEDIFQRVASESCEIERTQSIGSEIASRAWSVGADQIKEEEYEEDEDTRSEVYWRERLEHIMTGVTVNTIVLVLVSVDLVNLIVVVILDSLASCSGSGLSDRDWSTYLSAAVVACFIIEISLRVIAQRHRFWKSPFNIFDLFVVLASTVIVSLQLVVITSRVQLTEALSTATGYSTALRAISRVAMGLRIARVFFNIRKVKSLQGKLTDSIRKRVSQNKRRFVRQQFDLDLTYITNRVMAMSAPAFGGHTTYRNDIHVVSRFLSSMHYGKFFVFNLCDHYFSTDGSMGNYHPQMLFNQVTRIPFEDHSPPLLVEMITFCQDSTEYLLRDPKHVISVHCKGGKGRTGLMISALLLWSGHRRCATDALELFTFRRTEDYDPDMDIDSSGDDGDEDEPKMGLGFKRLKHNQGVSGPSQIRYIHYLETLLYSSSIDPYQNHKIFLKTIELPVGEIQARSPQFLSYTVHCSRTPVFDSRTQSGGGVFAYGGQYSEVIKLPCNVLVWGDVKICMYIHRKHSAASQRKLFFFTCINTIFYSKETRVTMSKRYVDVIHKDAVNRMVDPDFTLVLNLDPDGSELSQGIIATKGFRGVMEQYGKPVEFSRGDTIFDVGGKRRALYLITSGTAEGFVNDYDHWGGESARNHPLGACVPVRGDDGERPARVPMLTIVGTDCVVGESPFVSRCAGMPVRVRSERLKALMVEVDDSSSSHAAENSSFGISGVPPEDLPAFYKGLAHILAMQLSKALSEAVRLSGLKALNDRSGVLQDQDDREILRRNVLEVHGLPMSESMSISSKCFASFEELSLVGIGTGKKKSELMRLIIMEKHLILDPEIYGPTVSKNSSFAISIENLVTVRFKGRYLAKTIVMIYTSGLAASDTFDLEQQKRKTAGSKDDGNAGLTTTRTEVTFQTVARANQVYNALLVRINKAKELRARMQARPYESKDIQVLLGECGTAHTLKNGERLGQAKNTNSLFMVRHGSIKLTRHGRVYRVLGRGECFGLVEFVNRTVSGYYDAVASGPTKVFELQLDAAESKIQKQPEMESKFYFFICQLIECDLHDALWVMFPGTWSNQIDETQEVSIDTIRREEHQQQLRERKKQRAKAVTSPGGQRMSNMWKEAKEAGKWVVQSSDAKGPPSPPKGKRGSTGTAIQKDVTANLKSPPSPLKGSGQGGFSTAGQEESGGDGGSGSSIPLGYV